PQWRLPELADVDLLKKYRGHEYDDDENLPEPESRHYRLARHTGSVLHRALQIVVEKKLVQTLVGNNDGEARESYLQQQLPFWRIQLQQQGWQGHELAQALDKVTHAFTQTLNDPKGRSLLDNSHAHSACEFVLFHKQGERLRESIIDRTF